MRNVWNLLPQRLAKVQANERMAVIGSAITIAPVFLSQERNDRQRVHCHHTAQRLKRSASSKEVIL